MSQIQRAAVSIPANITIAVLK
ncbi:MAG: hypothetical protein LDL41_20935 [Coleofasciculus sp. S288]|nr:hypothetical protein [Coleofasciculus sp. S288]